jgi:hypothetical protein
MHPGPDAGVNALASLAGVPVSRAVVLLEELERVNVVTETTAGRFAMHDLLRAPRPLMTGISAGAARDGGLAPSERVSG